MKYRAILLLVFLSGGTAAAAWGQQQKPPKAETGRFGNPTSTARLYQDYIYGVIKKIDKNEIVLDKTASGVEEVFKMDAKTKFIYDSKSSSPDSLKVGEDVYVEVKKDKKTGDMVAKKVVAGLAATQTP